MMQDCCRNQPPLCQCIHWGDEDFDVEVDHLTRNFEFRRLALEYTTLEPGALCRLCQIGQCRQCGGRLCIGIGMTTRDTLEDTLAAIHFVSSHRWHDHTGKFPDGDTDFRNLFIQMFHEDDQQAVRAWLSQREVQAESQQTAISEQEAQ